MFNMEDMPHEQKGKQQMAVICEMAQAQPLALTDHESFLTCSLTL
jgi:hypothetical protein